MFNCSSSLKLTIEKEMKKVAKSGKKIIRHEITKEEALEMFKDDS